MLKITAAAAFGPLVAGASAIAPAFITNFEGRVPQRALKGDRLIIRPVGPGCSQAAWPHYENHCVRSATRPYGQPHQVRTVTGDR